jgi:ribosomal protein S16
MRADKKLIGKVGKYNPVITEEAKAKMHSSDGRPYWEKKCTLASLKTRKPRRQLRLPS